MYRKVQEEGLQVAYNDPTDRSIKTAVHQILSLAFVPPTDVPAVYDELRRELPRVVKALGDYFEKTYIRGVRRGHGRGRARVVRGPPRYPVEEWNQHHAAAHKEARTNNLTEGTSLLHAREILNADEYCWRWVLTRFSLRRLAQPFSGDDGEETPVLLPHAEGGQERAEGH